MSKYTPLFWKRLGEQTLVMGAGTFVATLSANAGVDVNRALILSAAAGVLRAVYGVVTAHLGIDEQQPSVK